MRITMPLPNEHIITYTYLCDRCKLVKQGRYNSQTDECDGFYRMHREPELAKYRRQRVVKVVDASGERDEVRRQEDFVCAECLHTDPMFVADYLNKDQ